MTSILVTGATGRVGCHLIKILSLYDKEFYISLRSTNCSILSVSQKVESFRNQGLFNFVDMDYNNLESISYHKLEGIEKIFLVSPCSNALDATKKIVAEAQKTQSVKHIVKLSVMGITPGSYTYEGIVHEHAEKIIKESGFHYTFLRPNYFMQNFMNLSFRNTSNEKIFHLPLKNERASFVDVRDVAEVAAIILHEKSNKHYNMIYDITGGQQLNCSDIAEILQTRLGEPIKYVNISARVAKTELIKTGLQLESIKCLLDFYRVIREGRMRQISKVVETILGRIPISFEVFVRDYIESFKNSIELKAVVNN